MNRTRSLSAAIIVMTAMSSFGSFASPRTARGERTPKWAISLNRLGVGERGSEQVTERSLGFFNTRRGISFMRDGNILIHFVARQSSVHLSQRQVPDQSDPFQLVAALVNSKNGEVITRKSWPTTSTAPSLVKQLTSNRFIVLAHERAMFLDCEFNVVHEINLRIIGKSILEGYRVFPAKSGPLIALQHGYNTKSVNQIINGETFQVLEQWEDTHLSSLAINGSEIVETNGQSRLLKVKRLGENWSVLDISSLQNLSQPTFLSDRALALSSGNELVCLTTDGDVLWNVKYPERERLQLLTSSQDGHRIAVYLHEVHGGFLDTPHFKSSVVVYDASSGKSLVKLRLADEPKWHFAFALSPDGLELAVLRDDKVELYDLE